jgi:hypothetical protein
MVKKIPVLFMQRFVAEEEKKKTAPLSTYSRADFLAEHEKLTSFAVEMTRETLLRVKKEMKKGRALRVKWYNQAHKKEVETNGVPVRSSPALERNWYEINIFQECIHAVEKELKKLT